ncbi:stage III sporulation protein AF [Desulfoscipio gibsoniae]|uniref:Stage III sporulation protein AF n=1 Tax=Desulfoscipio gibsoniae DSM 7213 TaxID=767817 RepID=R4KHF6_9FIRM|nr:stage III sporulation protein AF [Desulfoscipio gibsoniae]AGL02024.1 stage III sporulation protein AF [Desulfoscipio gibsoniae DSM 7213]
MDLLRELIQTIIVIVLLAVLVEMLLPGGDMRRYVKTVMGLLIIMAVLQAAAGVINKDFMQDIPAVTVSDTGDPPLEEIMAAGQELADTNRDKAVQQYSEGLSNQVLALAGMNPDVQPVDARVSIDGKNSDIKEITIVFNAAPVGGAGDDSGGGDTLSADSAGSGGRRATDSRGGELDVQPVVVDIDGKETSEEVGSVTVVSPEQKQAAAGLTAVVAEFYNLKPEQVKYEFRE